MPETQELTYRHGDTTLTGQVARPSATVRTRHPL